MRSSMRWLLLVGVFVGCGPPEARDPSEILAEDPAFLPPTDTYDGQASGAPRAPERDRVATRSECEGAMRHLEELGLDIAIAGATDPNEKARLRAKKGEIMNSAAVRERIRRAADDCFARETPASEVRCVSRVRAEKDLDACAR